MKAAEEVWSDWQQAYVRVIHVGKSAAGAYRTLSEALTRSSPGDRIEVEAGEYFEAISVSHQVELVGADDGDLPLITSRGPVVNINCDQPVLLHQLRVIAKGTKPQEAVSMLVVKGSPTITDCVISCLHVTNMSSPTVRKTVIANSDVGSGLRISDRASGQYVDCQIYHHPNTCVEISTNASPMLQGNTIFQKKTFQTVVSIIGGEHGRDCTPILENNVISGNGETVGNQTTGVAYDSQKALMGSVDATGALVSISWGSAPLLLGNTLVKGAVGIQVIDAVFSNGCSGNTIELCSSWGVVIGPNAEADIADNVIARNGGGVRAVGVRSFAIKKVSVTTNAQWGILFDNCSGLVDTCTLASNGIGVGFVHGGNGHIVGSTLVANKLHGALSQLHSTGQFHECEIQRNGASGITVTECSNTKLMSCTFEENGSNVVISGSSFATAANNRIQGPKYHNVVVTDRSNVNFHNNNIEGSAEFASIAIAKKSCGHFTKNEVKRGGGAGFSVESSSFPTLESNTIMSFTVGIHVGEDGDAMVLKNTIASCARGISVVDGGIGTFEGNILRLCDALICTEKEGGGTFRGNTVCDTPGNAIKIGPQGKGLFEKNVIQRCKRSVLLLHSHEELLLVKNALTESDDYGVFASTEAKGTVEKNTMMRVGAGKFTVGSEDKSEVLFKANIIRSTGGGCSIYAGPEGMSTFVANDIRDSRGRGVEAHTGTQCKLQRNKILDGLHDGVVIYAGAAVTFDGDTISTNKGVGIFLKGSADGGSSEQKVLGFGEQSMALDSTAEVSLAETMLHQGGPTCVLTDVTISNNDDHGVLAMKGADGHFKTCIIEGNNASGISAVECGPVTFSKCEVRNHPCCVSITKGGHSAFHDCIIEDSTNPRLGLFVIDRGGHSVVENCKITGSESYGIIVGLHSTLDVSQGSIEHCRQAGVYAVEEKLESNLRDVTVKHCNVGVEFSHSQKDAAKIAIAHGHDFEKHRADSIIPDPSHFGVGLVTCTISDCDHDAVIFQPNSAGRIEGCVIKRSVNGIHIHDGSHCFVKACEVSHSSGSAMLVTGTPHMASTIAGNILFDNSEYGIHVERNHGSTFSGGRIEKNGYGGVLVVGGTPNFVEVSVGEHDDEGFLLTEGCSCDITRCRVEGCHGSGVRLKDESRPKILGGRIASCDVGMLIGSDCFGKMSGTDFHSNRIGFVVQATTSSRQAVGELTLNELVMTTCSFRIDEGVFDNNSVGLEVCEGAIIRVFGTEFRMNTKVGVQLQPSSMVYLHQVKVNGNSLGVLLSPSEGTPSTTFIKPSTSPSKGGKSPKKASLNRASLFSLGNESLDLAGARGLISECSFTHNDTGCALESEGMLLICENTFTGSTIASLRIHSNDRVVVQDNHFVANRGSGVEFTKSSATISHNIFEDGSLGVRASDGEPTIEKCFFRNCKVGLSTITTYSSPLITACVFSACERGVRASDSGGGTVYECHFLQNSIGGLVSEQQATLTVEKSIFEQHADGAYGLILSSGSRSEVRINTFMKNQDGISMENATSMAKVHHNQITDSRRYGIVVHKGGGGRIESNRFARNGVADIYIVGATTDLEVESNVFSSGSQCAGVSGCDGATGRISGNVFDGSGGVGVVVAGAGTALRVEGNHFRRGLETGAITRDGAGGIFIKNLFTNVVVGISAKARGASTFRENTLLQSQHNAVAVERDAAPVIERCTMGGGAPGSSSKPIVLWRGGGEMKHSFVSGGTIGIHVGEHTESAVIQKNRIRDCRVGLMAGHGSTALVTTNIFTTNDTGVQLQPGTDIQFVNNNIFANHRTGLMLNTAATHIESNNITSSGSDGAVHIPPEVDTTASALQKAGNVIKHNVHGGGGDMDRIVPNVVPSAVPKESTAMSAILPNQKIQAAKAVPTEDSHVTDNVHPLATEAADTTIVEGSTWKEFLKAPFLATEAVSPGVEKSSQEAKSPSSRKLRGTTNNVRTGVRRVTVKSIVNKGTGSPSSPGRASRSGSSSRKSSSAFGSPRKTSSPSGVSPWRKSTITNITSPTDSSPRTMSAVQEDFASIQLPSELEPNKPTKRRGHRRKTHGGALTGPKSRRKTGAVGFSPRSAFPASSPETSPAILDPAAAAAEIVRRRISKAFHPSERARVGSASNEEIKELIRSPTSGSISDGSRPTSPGSLESPGALESPSSVSDSRMDSVILPEVIVRKRADGTMTSTSTIEIGESSDVASARRQRKPPKTSVIGVTSPALRDHSDTVSPRARVRAPGDEGGGEGDDGFPRVVQFAKAAHPDDGAGERVKFATTQLVVDDPELPSGFVPPSITSTSADINDSARARAHRASAARTTSISRSASLNATAARRLRERNLARRSQQGATEQDGGDGSDELQQDSAGGDIVGVSSGFVLPSHLAAPTPPGAQSLRGVDVSMSCPQPARYVRGPRGRFHIEQSASAPQLSVGASASTKRATTGTVPPAASTARVSSSSRSRTRRIEEGPSTARSAGGPPANYALVDVSGEVGSGLEVMGGSSTQIGEGESSPPSLLPPHLRTPSHHPRQAEAVPTTTSSSSAASIPFDPSRPYETSPFHANCDPVAIATLLDPRVKHGAPSKELVRKYGLDVLSGLDVVPGPTRRVRAPAPPDAPPAGPVSPSGGRSATTARPVGDASPRFLPTQTDEFRQRPSTVPQLPAPSLDDILPLALPSPPPATKRQTSARPLLVDKATSMSLVTTHHTTFPGEEEGL